MPTALILDDEPKVRAALERLLAREGWDVLHASSETEAILRCRHHDRPVDLLIVDVMLRENSGAAAAKTLSVIAPNALVVLTSGYDAPTLRKIGVDVDGGIFLPKPPDPDQLIAILRTASSA